MARKNKGSHFWTSYSDLMTNLFFVMLMLFILAIALLHREMVLIGKERDATKAEIEISEKPSRVLILRIFSMCRSIRSIF